MRNCCTSAPLLSVVVPAYQAELSIGRLLNSILEWDGDDIEVIVVNDGSDDATHGIVAERAAHDFRVYLIDKENQGRSAARNDGIAAARAEWIMFADSDDYLLAGWQDEVRGAIARDFDMTIFSMVRSDGLDTFGNAQNKSSVLKRLPLPAASVRKALVDGSFRNLVEDAGAFEWNACCSRLYRRTLVDRAAALAGGAAFPVGLRFSEDRLFNLCCLSALGERDVLFDYQPIYFWDMGLSSTVAQVKPGDAEVLIPYRAALCRMDDAFDSEEVDIIVAMELASQFRRAASLPIRELGEAAATWKGVLESGSLVGCRPCAASFMGRRSWLFKLPIALLFANLPALGLICQHAIQRIGEGVRRVLKGK